MEFYTEFWLTCFSICNCWIVFGGGPVGKKDSFVGLLGVPDDKSPRISNSENGLVTDGGATGENDLGANKSCCCGRRGTVLDVYGCCRVALKGFVCAVGAWGGGGGKLVKGFAAGGAELGMKFSTEFVVVDGWVFVVESSPNISSKG